MNDIFMEYLIKKNKDTKDKLLIALVIVGAVAVSFLLMLAMLALSAASLQSGGQNPLGSMVFSIGLLLVALAWYLVYIFIGSRNVEYEYILTNNDFDIDKVMAKKGRKHLISFDVREAACIACVKDSENNEVYRNKPEGVKLLDYSGKSNNSEVYFADVQLETGRSIVLFQPTSKMVEAMWKFNPRGVHKYNF